MKAQCPRMLDDICEMTAVRFSSSLFINTSKILRDLIQQCLWALIGKDLSWITAKCRESEWLHSMCEENDKLVSEFGKKGDFIKNTITHTSSILQHFRAAPFFHWRYGGWEFYYWWGCPQSCNFHIWYQIVQCAVVSHKEVLDVI